MKLVVIKSNFQVLFVPSYRDLHYHIIVNILLLFHIFQLYSKYPLPWNLQNCENYFDNYQLDTSIYA